MKLKSIIKFLILLICIILLIFAYFYNKYPFLLEYKAPYNKQYTIDAAYLDKDSTNKTIAQKKIFEKLKKQFLEQWLDSSNCFTEELQQLLKDNPPSIKVHNIFIDNIFYTPNIDTVIVLVAYYTEYTDERKFKDSQVEPFRAIIDSNNIWRFDCGEHGRYILSHTGNEKLNELCLEYRRVLVSMGILDENKHINNKFFHHYFTEEWEVIP